MQHWILDVLQDMRSFAASNGMPDLASELEGVSRTAAAEIARSRAAGGGATLSQALAPPAAKA